MANLFETAELAFRQIFPNPGDETGITREEFMSTAREIYSRSMWLQMKLDKREEGLWNVPSNLLTETKLEVVDDEIDLSKLKILRSLPNDLWLQNVGGLTCKCTYIGSNINLTQLLCDDEFQDDSYTYVIVGKKIKFPKGTHDSHISIIYANNGSEVDEKRVEIDDAIAATVRDQLINLYLRKGMEDVTNNTNSNQ